MCDITAFISKYESSNKLVISNIDTKGNISLEMLLKNWIPIDGQKAGDCGLYRLKTEKEKEGK